MDYFIETKLSSVRRTDRAWKWTEMLKAFKCWPISFHFLPDYYPMSGAGARENVFATRMALTNTKLRLKGAQTGHSLLAKKRDALTTRFRAILKKVDEVR
jgi:hypothetical protein